MRLGFGSDHAGFSLRRFLVDKFPGPEYGATDANAYDYPDAADALCRAILAKDLDLGVLICGSGIGVAIRANRYPGIRAANCCNPEVARLARSHNSANVLALGARLLSTGEAEAILSTFLATEPDSAERHVRRAHMLDLPCV